MRYAQLVMGPAGSGKSTYCQAISEHCEAAGRTVHVINLDPAAETFHYPVTWDIRDVVSVDDVAETLGFGPNGGLVYCMEFLMSNIEALDDAIGDYDEDYLVLDCPGQIELYTHIPVMTQLVEHLQSRDVRVCGVYLLDAQFLDDTSKFFSGVLSALSVMINLSVPHVNVLTKTDLIQDPDTKRELEHYLDPDTEMLLNSLDGRTVSRHHALNAALASLIEEYSLVRFLPMSNQDTDSVGYVLQIIDHCLQFGEDADVKEPKEVDPDDLGDSSAASAGAV
eukprot:m.192066 g.192066  ORF g.192066 m.192066 type:complete len:280 (+) comp18258_c0_seq4:109-948(+)